MYDFVLVVFSLGVAVIFVVILQDIFVCDCVYLYVSVWFGLCAVVCDCVPDCNTCLSEWLCSPRSLLRAFMWCAFV